jgi:hypothetical protein
VKTEIRVSGVRLWIKRPDHPEADSKGFIRVDVWRGWSGLDAVVFAETLSHGRTLLTTTERAVAEQALMERDQKLERGDRAWP